MRAADGVRVTSLVAFIVSSAVPSPAIAEPGGPDLAAVDRDFRRGQDEFNRGEFIAAARAWVQAASHLPETPQHRNNRAGIYGYIADAYTRGIGDQDGALLLEALNVLDTYTDGYAAAYPGEKLPDGIIRAQKELRARAAALQATDDETAGGPQPPPPPTTTVEPPPAKPWKGLVIGGGVALGVSVGMLAMFGASLRQVGYYEDMFNRPGSGCDPNALQGECEEWFNKATSRDRAAVAGLVAAPVFLAAGATMLVLGLRRKAGRHTVAPALGGGMAGATWRVRF